MANVGDSRGVICDKNGRAVPLSYDHKPYNVSILPNTHKAYNGSILQDTHSTNLTMEIHPCRVSCNIQDTPQVPVYYRIHTALYTGTCSIVQDTHSTLLTMEVHVYNRIHHK